MKWNAHTHKANKACCCTVLQKWTSLLVHRSFQSSILHAIHFVVASRSSPVILMGKVVSRIFFLSAFDCSSFFFFFCVARERVSVLPDQNCCAVATSWKNTHMACVGWKKKSTKFIVCFVFFVLIYGWRRRNVRNKNFRPTCKGCPCGVIYSTFRKGLGCSVAKNAISTKRDVVYEILEILVLLMPTGRWQVLNVREKYLRCAVMAKVLWSLPLLWALS